MATLPKDFIGKDALQHVADQVSKEILMGPGYTDAAEMDRLGIDIVSGVQYKRTFHILLRKGGTTRRKDVHKKVNSEVGFLKERTLTVKLSWDHYTANADDFCETVFGVGAQEQFPLNEPRGGEAQQCAFRAFRGGGLRAGGRCRDGFCRVLRRACRDLAASDARLARGDPQGDD